MTLFVLKNGNRLGPYTVEQVADLIRKGELLLTDSAWHEGKSEWQSIHALPEIVSVVLPPIPNTGELPKVGNSASQNRPTVSKDSVKDPATSPLKLENKTTGFRASLIRRIAGFLLIVFSFVYTIFISPDPQSKHTSSGFGLGGAIYEKYHDPQKDSENGSISKYMRQLVFWGCLISGAYLMASDSRKEKGTKML